MENIDWVSVYLIVALSFGFLNGLILGYKGRNIVGGFMLGFFFPVIGIIISLLLSPTQAVQEEKALQRGEIKRCPYCLELVKAKAVKCRYCHSELNSNE